MSYARILLATLLVAVLAACGGPTTPPVPPKPTISAVTPAVAPRGGAIVVDGADFGTSGKLMVGGVEAVVSSWTDAKIEATVASGTLDGWQDVVVDTADGTDDFSPFFVGEEYSGAASGLQAFLDGLDKGTAVLLQAQTYDLSAETDELLLDNHGLYGRGETQTTIKLSLTGGAIVLSDWGATVTIADLAIEGDFIAFFHGNLVKTLETLGSNMLTAVPLNEAMVTRTISLPQATGVTDTWSTETFSELGSPVDVVPSAGALTTTTRAPRVFTVEALAHTPEVALAPAGLSTPKITLQDVSYSDVMGGGSFGFPMFMIPTLDITLADVDIDADNSSLVLVSNSNMTLERVTATTAMAIVGSYGGTLTVLDSTVESATDVGLWAEAGMRVNGSTVRAADGYVDVVGAARAILGGSTDLAGGFIEVVGSTIEALDGNLADGTVNGFMIFETQFAPITLTDNVRIRSHEATVIVTQQSFNGEGDITLAGNGDVRAGVFKSEDPVNFRPGDIYVTTGGGGSLADVARLEGNTMAATATLVVDLSGSSSPGFLSASHNKLTAGDGENDGLLQLIAGATGQLRLEDNVLSADGMIEVTAPDLSETTAVLAGNTVSAVGAGSPAVVSQLNGGSCEVSGNTFEAEDVSAVNSTLVQLTCVGADPLVDAFTVTGNTMTANGNGGSIIVTQFSSGALTMASNQIGAEAIFWVFATDVDGVVSANDIQLADGQWMVFGDPLSDLTLDANVVAYEDASYGLGISGVGSATVTGNEFTVNGTPAPSAVAFGFATSGAPITIAASGNTFTNFSRALYVVDLATTAWGITATIEDNVFDFPIDAAPKVAELVNVKSAIDARNNRWGTNTSAATVATYVTLSGDTGVQGGSILLSPITLP